MLATLPAPDLVARARADWRAADLAALEAECAVRVAHRRLKHATDYLAEVGGLAMGAPAPPAAKSEPASARSLEDVLRDACHGFRDARAHWSRDRLDGLSDEALAGNVDEAFGHQGSSESPPASWKGKRGDPKFWWGSTDFKAAPTLAGKALIDKAREVLEMPLPGQGLKSKPSSDPPRTPGTNIERVNRMCDTFGLERPVFSPGPPADQYPPDVLNRDPNQCTRCESPGRVTIKLRAHKNGATSEEFVCEACAAVLRKDKWYIGETECVKECVAEPPLVVQQGDRSFVLVDPKNPADLQAATDAAVPSWRKLTLEAAGFMQGDDAFEENLCEALVSAGVVTCGELADRLLAGELFGLEPYEIDDVYASIEVLSGDDEQPIEFEEHFATKKPEPEPERLIPGEPKDTLEAGLRYALTRFQGGAARWVERVKKGMTDAALKEAIGYEFGAEGGGSGPAMKRYGVKGGKDPKFWYGTMNRSGKPTLAGAALVHKVREVMGIPLASHTGDKITPAPGSKAAKKAKPAPPAPVPAEEPPSVEVGTHPLPARTEPTVDVTRLSDIDGFPDAVADKLAPAVTTLATLLERVGAWQGAIKDMPFRTRLRAFLVSAIGVKERPAEHAAEAVADRVSKDHIFFCDVPGFPAAAAIHLLKEHKLRTVADAVEYVELAATRPDVSPVYEALRVLGLPPGLITEAGAKLSAHFGDRFKQPAFKQPASAEQPSLPFEEAAEPAPPPATEPRDKTEVWERRLAGDVGAHGQDANRMAACIDEFRDCQKTSLASPVWNRWSEFEVAIPAGHMAGDMVDVVRVLSKPFWDGENGRHHVEMWSPALGPAGYWSLTIVRGGKGGDLLPWAEAEAERRAAEYAAETGAEKPKGKPAPKKTAVEQLTDLGLLSKTDGPAIVVPTGPEPELPFGPANDPTGNPWYGWGIEYRDNRGKTQHCHYVGTEKKARGKARTRSGVERLTACDGMTREQYERTYGRGRM